MLRTMIVALGTLVGGLVIYVLSTTVLHIVGKEPWMTIDLLASLILAGWLTARFIRRTPSPAENFSLKEMEERGQLIREKYEAARAFQVEEFEDEGCQYFIELKGGRVLFLCGQYLYDYEPSDGTLQEKTLRKFPCTEFTVLRHKENGYVLDVECGGTVLEPEFEAPHFGEYDHDPEPPSDGDIITDRSYDVIKQEMMPQARKQ